MNAEIIDRDGRRRRACKRGEILKDGERIVVALNMMDGVQRSVAQQSRRMIDGGAHRPGYRGGTASTAALDAYDAAGEALRGAWRNPDAAPQPSVTKRQPTGDARENAWLAQGQAVKDAWRNVA